LHKVAPQWKGYLSVETWHAAKRLWLPTVLEVTEHCELDLRDHYQRGQVWEVSRAKEVTKKKQPVRATLLEQCDEKTFPQPHDLLPVLRTIYHHLQISLEHENPMPGRVMVEPSTGAPPPLKVHPAEDARVSPEQLKKLREEFDRRKLA
jgi:hypothetical protein